MYLKVQYRNLRASERYLLKEGGISEGIHLVESCIIDLLIQYRITSWNVVYHVHYCKKKTRFQFSQFLKGFRLDMQMCALQFCYCEIHQYVFFFNSVEKVK